MGSGNCATLYLIQVMLLIAIPATRAQLETTMRTGNLELLDGIEIPTAIAVPSGNEVHVVLRAEGHQHYTFNGTNWVVENATAKLYGSGSGGAVVGRHFYLAEPDANGGQPTWQSFDHPHHPSLLSAVTAKSLVSVTVDADSITWNLLQATSHTGNTEFGHVNYEDPHFNVGLPIFTIHGNHDDPAGVDNLSAIDILSACNLVNYFGKMVLGGSGVGQITLHPILMQKGTTKVALYGFGNIRDERLNRMFQTPHAVRWIRPEIQGDSSVSDWFNILVLHQNRVKTNPKNAVNEHFLPRFLDFIVWGHEHECLVDPEEVAGMGFHLSQPGSSIATSLIDGEAKPKHVLLLEIKGSQYRPTKIPLNSVRAFEFAEVSLKDESDLDPNDPEAVLDHLSKLVHDLITRANGKVVSRPELRLPLIRIKVDYTGYTTINPQRFGQKFVGKVANPHDILIFTKAAKRRQGVTDKEQEKELLRPEELNQQNIEALVAESNLKMEILPVNDLDVALHEFVNKDDKQAFYDCVQNNLEETRAKLAEETDVLQIKEEKDLIEKVSQCMQERVLKGGSSSKTGPARSSALSQGSLAPSTRKGGFSDEEDADTELRGGARNAKVSQSTGSTKGRGGRTNTTTRGRGRGSRGNLKQTTLDMSISTTRSQRAASAAARTAFQSSDQDAEDIGTSSGSEEVMADAIAESESEPEPTPTKGRKRKATPSKDKRPPASGQKRGRKSTSSGITRTTYIDMVDDNDEDEEDQRKPVASAGGQTQTRRSWGSLRR